MVVVALVLLLIGIGSFGYLYNHHVAPLARLASEIEVGDPFSEVHQKFVSYYKSRGPAGSIDFTARNSESGQWTADVMVPANGLYLSDHGFFDDIKLTVEFDSGGKVQRISLIGD